MFSKKPIVIACALLFAGANLARADDTADLKAKLEALQRQMDALKTQLDKVTHEQHEQHEQRTAPSTAAAAPAAGPAGYSPVSVKDGDATIFRIGHHDIQVYGNLDISIDDATKGFNSAATDAVGKLGWNPGVSANLSYVGVRGKHKISNEVDFVYQLETGLDLAISPGTVNTNSNNSGVVNGALTSRNTFIGLAGEFGAFKVGKTDAPYKNSTSRFDPFSGMQGTYSSIMGNTGGDNRVEFGTRMDHAIWWESPNWSGVHVNLLFSPGQQRSTDNSIIASSEGSCTGGNLPGSGALSPQCSDGSYGNAYSADISYSGGPFYGAAAYEMHKGVNRVSDTIGVATTPAADSQGDPNDVGDEHAYKFAAMYTFPTKTTVGVIWERTQRNVPGYLEYQNERTRPHATWLVVSQALTPADSIHFGWAHAGTTPGDPGQHDTPSGFGPDNAANMYTMAYKHSFDKHASWYFDYATTVNHSAAHYDLGAGGHGITTDCHDGTELAAFDPTANGGAGGISGNGPHCYPGGHLQGISVGLKYVF